MIEDEKWRRLGDVDALVAAPLTALAAREAKVAAGTVAIVLSNDAEVRQLNKTWRQKDKPTNVLSFPHLSARQWPEQEPHLGDVVLARETIEKEARELSIPLAHHLQHLVLHGVLHLLGYDHETDDDARIMERLETAILAAIGVHDPYGDAGDDVVSDGATGKRAS